MDNHKNKPADPEITQASVPAPPPPPLPPRYRIDCGNPDYNGLHPSGLHFRSGIAYTLDATVAQQAMSRGMTAEPA